VSTLEVAVAVAVMAVSQSLLHPAHLIKNPRVQIFNEPAYIYLAIYNTQRWELQLNLLNSTDKEKK